MDFVVVDTDIVSFCFKHDSRAQPYVANWTGKTLVVSFMTLAELRLWEIVRNWGQGRISQFRSFLKQHFAVHPANERLCGLWALLMAESCGKGTEPSNCGCLDRGNSYCNGSAAGHVHMSEIYKKSGLEAF